MRVLLNMFYTVEPVLFDIPFTYFGLFHLFNFTAGLNIDKQSSVKQQD